ncbi:MAG TPA: hypothetical protein VGP47_03005 [Parachlamydiaceae bacterium]|nr:hypothetical protein [Parachlamydiaceae bacterium]
MTIQNPLIDATANLMKSVAWAGLKTVEKATDLVEAAALVAQVATGLVLIVDIEATTPNDVKTDIFLKSFRLVKERFTDTLPKTPLATNFFPTQHADLETLHSIQRVAALALMTVLPGATMVICHKVRSLTTELIIGLENRW